MEIEVDRQTLLALLTNNVLIIMDKAGTLVKRRFLSPCYGPMEATTTSAHNKTRKLYELTVQDQIIKEVTSPLLVNVKADELDGEETGTSVNVWTVSVEEIKNCPSEKVETGAPENEGTSAHEHEKNSAPEEEVVYCPK